MNENRNDRTQRLDYENSREIERIRQNEIIARQKRARKIEQNKREEMRKRARIKRLKDTISAWLTLVCIVVLAIAFISMIVSSCNGDENDKLKQSGENMISQSVQKAVSDFVAFDGKIYSSENDALYNGANSVYALSSESDFSVAMPSAFLWQAKSLSHSATQKNSLRTLKDAIRDFPQFSNGYIWSSAESIKYGNTGNYLYDTNARYISAVAEICLWETDTSFLYETDTNTNGRLDASLSKSVLDKLEEATEYFFDKNDLNGGGIRYNEADGLCYVLTTANNGLSNGAGSNYWFNHRFGYLDCYNNIAFNEAMQYLSKLYTLMGQPDKAKGYADIAEKNRIGINNVFWNGTRYIGAKDTDGKTHDLGFTFLNLEAISTGVADSEKTEKILSWLDGKINIDSDTSVGEDIYKNGYAPRSTTIAANDSWWDYVSGNYPLSDTCAFGKYYQNGGTSAVVAALDLEARRRADDISGLKKRIVALGEYKTEIKTSVAERKENSVIFSQIADSLFDFSTDGSRLYIKPLSIKEKGYVGVKNVSFGTGVYSFMFGNSSVIATSLSENPIRLVISGFDKNSDCEVNIVREGKIEMTEKLKADENGNLSLSERFGGNVILYITSTFADKEEK